MSSRFLRRLAARLALLGLLLAATAPTFARLASGEAALAMVCTPQGLRALSAADPGDQPPAGPGAAGIGLLDHCPYCSHALEQPALPPALRGLPAPWAGAAGPGPALTVPQAAAPPWPRAQPRAPPPTPGRA